MHILHKSKKAFIQGRFVFMAIAPEARTETLVDSPKDKKDQAKTAVNDALNRDVAIALDTTEKAEKSILNEKQVKVLEKGGVSTVQVEKGKTGPVTRLYFDTDVTIQVRQGGGAAQDYLPRKIGIDHNTTVGITIAGREEPNDDGTVSKVTDIILDNTDGSRDMVTIRKKK